MKNPQHPKAPAKPIFESRPPRRYEVRILGHSLPTIQDQLDAMAEAEQLIAVVAVGVNLFGVIDLAAKRAWIPPENPLQHDELIAAERARLKK